MSRIRGALERWASPVTVLFCILLLAGRAVAGDAIVVVVSPASPVDEISSATLKGIYLGKETSLGGVPSAPVNYKGGTPIRNVFEKAMMGMEPDEVTKHWQSQKFLGFAENQPVIYTTPDAVKKFVSRQKGAIGYLLSSQVDQTIHVVKKVNGFEVSTPAYPYVMP